MKELFPNSTTPRLEQYKLAWAALHKPCKSDAAHAKCWLTYRAFDGQVTHKDWQKHVEPVDTEVNEPKENIRWKISFGAAAYYLATVQNDERRRSYYSDRLQIGDIELCPGAILSLCRVAAIRAHEAELMSQTELCAKIINDAFGAWKNTMGKINPMNHPHRFIEAMDDLNALQSLVFTAQKINILNRILPHEGWVYARQEAIRINTQPWAQCIRHLNNKHSKI